MCGIRGDGALSRDEAAPLDDVRYFLHLGPVERAFAAGHLKAVIIGRVVAPGHHDAAFHVQGEEGKVKQGRRHNAEVYHRQAPFRHALHDKGPEPVGAEPAVPSDRRLRLAPLPHIRGKGPPYLPHQIVGQIGPDDPPDIIFPENIPVHPGPSSFLTSLSVWTRHAFIGPRGLIRPIGPIKTLRRRTTRSGSARRAPKVFFDFPRKS